MMTVSEAKTKWCPMARLHVTVDGVWDNRPGGQMANEGSVRCIASQCMAWRWDSRVAGYCGAFGKPA